MAYFLGLGEQFPYFEKKAVVSIEAGKEFALMSNNFSSFDGDDCFFFKIRELLA